MDRRSRVWVHIIRCGRLWYPLAQFSARFGPRAALQLVNGALEPGLASSLQSFQQVEKFPDRYLNLGCEKGAASMADSRQDDQPRRNAEFLQSGM